MNASEARSLKAQKDFNLWWAPIAAQIRAAAAADATRVKVQVPIKFHRLVVAKGYNVYSGGIYW